jgi:hypothetical protein
MTPATVRVPIGKVDGRITRWREDIFAVEEPLEICVASRSLSVTMRTPGHDFELAAVLYLQKTSSAVQVRFAGSRIPPRTSWSSGVSVFMRHAALAGTMSTCADEGVSQRVQVCIDRQYTPRSSFGHCLAFQVAVAYANLRRDCIHFASWLRQRSCTANRESRARF